MITLTQISGALAKGQFLAEQKQAVLEAHELSRWKIQEEVETDLKEWMNDRLATKVELADLGANLRAEMHAVKAETIKWMFIFWVGQFAATFALLKFVK